MDRANMITTPTKYHYEKTTHYETQRNPSTSDGLFVKASHITVPKRQSTKLRRSTKRTSNKHLNKYSTKVLKETQQQSQTSQPLSRSQATLSNQKISTITEQNQKRLTLVPNNLHATNNLEKQSSGDTQPTEIKQLNNLESITFPEIENQDDQNTNSPNANDYPTVLFQDALEKESNGNILIMTAVSYKENNKTDEDTQTDNKLVTDDIKDENKQLNQQINKLSDNDIEDLISTESIESSEDEHEIRSAFSNFTFSTNRQLTTFAHIMPTQIENTIQSVQNSQMSQLTSLTSQASTTSSIQKKEETKETDTTISIQSEEDDKPEKTTLQNPVKETQELETVQEHGKLYTAACNMAKFVKEHPVAVIAATCTLAASIYFGTAGIQQVGTFASSQWQKLLAMISTILPK